MSWTIVDTALMADNRARVVQVDVPIFTDEIDYEGIVGRAFSTPADLDFFASGGIIMLVTAEGQEEMQKLTDRAGWLRRQGFVSELRRIGLERKAVCLRWSP